MDNLNLDKIITDEFISKNTTLASVKAFVDKSGKPPSAEGGFGLFIKVDNPRFRLAEYYIFLLWKRILTCII